MDAFEQARMADHEENYWWHVGRRYLIRHMLERYVGAKATMDIVDVGCGSGRNLELLDQFGRAVGVEPAGPGLNACRERGLDSDRVVEGDASDLPFPDGNFDLACAFDVLEHLDDDAEGIAEMRRVLRSSGMVLVTVPAYRFLWSVHDEALGHRRRYIVSELHSLLNRGGFAIIRQSYAISMALLPIIGFRFAQRLIPTSHEKRASYVEVPTWLNNLLINAIKIESKLIEVVNLPAGASIIALARRTD